MAAHSRSKGGSPGTARSRWFLAGGLVCLLLLAFSAVSTFSGPWLRVDTPSTVDPAAQDSLVLSPRTDPSSPGAWLQDFLQGNPNTEPIPGNMDSPFASGIRRDLIAAQGDPFLLALAAGIDEGRLVVKSQSSGIPLLGPPVPANRPHYFSDSEIFGSLQVGVSGSFRNFFASLFGKPSPDKSAVQRADVSSASLDENPFSQAKQSIAENAPAEPKDLHQEAAVEKPVKKDAEPPVEKAAAPPAPAAAIAPPAMVGNAPIRPDLILHVAGDGTLQSMAAGQTSDGAFESAQLGIQKFDLIPFGDTADFPASIVVADFNGDGYPDVAYYWGMQGALRFFYGSAAGTFEEGLRIDVGLGQRSIVAGDFNGDGKMDIAISNVGTGLLTILYSDSPTSYTFKSYYLDSYRDYIAIGRTTNPYLIGMNFANTGTLLLDFNQPGAGTPNSFDFSPTFSSQVLTSQGYTAQLNAVVSDSNLSLNISNHQKQLVNVLNIAAGTNVYTIVGELSNDGRIVIGIGTPHH